MKKQNNRIISIVTAVFMALTVFTVPVVSVGKTETSNNTEVVLNNPRIENGVSTWDCVYFGNYPQSSDGNGGFKTEPIKWRVLSVDNNEAILLSNQSIDTQPYNIESMNITWEESTIRSWLNGYDDDKNIYGEDYTSENFIDTAFSADEQKSILTENIINNENEEYYTYGGYNTDDKIYLLSLNDILKSDYGFKSDSTWPNVEKGSTNTDYAQYRGAFASDSIDYYYGNGYYWLRSPGGYQYHAAVITYDTSVNFYGYEVNLDSCGVRPVIHIDLTSDLWKYAGTVSSDGTVNEDLQLNPSVGQVTEEALYGEYANYLHNNPAYTAMLSSLYTELEKPVYGTSSDKSSSAKLAMQVVGNFDIVRYVKLLLGKDDTEKELAEELAVEMIRAVEHNDKLFNDVMDDVENLYKWTSNTYGIVSSGYQSDYELQQISELLSSGYVYSEKSAKKLIKEMDSAWKQSEKAFETAGIVINSTQLAAEVIMTMEANHIIVTKLKNNLPENSSLYNALETIEQKQKKSLGENLGEKLLTEEAVETIASELAQKGASYGSGAFKPVGMCFVLASELIPVSADDKVKALHADANCGLISVAVKGKAVELKQYYTKNKKVSNELKQDYQLLFELYMQAIELYKENALSVANAKEKKRINSIYNAVEKHLNYDAYIQSCLNNANTSYYYTLDNNKAIIEGISNSNIAANYSADKVRTTATSDTSGLLIGIPEKIDGYQVLGIEDNFIKGNSEIELIYLPDTVESIGNSSFEGCTSLKRVFMGSNVKSIGESAFKGCAELESINIPYSVTNIGDCAFADIEGLEINACEGSEASKYADSNDNITLELKDIKISFLEIKTLPSKLKYTIGEKIDLSGLKVVAIYEDGTEADVTDAVYCGFESQDIGEYTVNLCYKDLVATFTVEIVPISINSKNIILSQTRYTYDGKPKTPKVSVDGLKEGTDFNVTYENNINPGEASVVVTGKGNFVGSITKYFTITKANQSISGPSTINKTYGNKAFYLGAKAPGRLTYKSSNSKIATVSRSGKVTIKNTGRVTITVTAAATGYYNATAKKVTINVSPKKVGSVKAKETKKKMTVSWKKDTKASGYQVVYSTDKKFKKNVKTSTISKNKTVKKTIKKLKSKKYYYVKVRAYKKIGSTKVYGPYSSVKKVKIK